MQLPGGILSEGVINKDYCFKPVTGLLELGLGDKAVNAENQSARISQILYQALATLGGEAVTLKQIRALCVGDRQFLMRQLAAHIDDKPIWLTVSCNECSQQFDFSVRHSQLPVKPAGKNFPEFVLKTRQGKFKLRVPTGLDQELIADIDNEGEALEKLLDCLITPLSITAPSDHYSSELISLLEQHIEDMSPEIATDVLAECPYCLSVKKVTLTPYACLERPAGNLFSEIHALALHYHWSEQEILSLPRSRRLMYLSLIDQGRDMFSTSDRFEGI